MTLGEGGLGVAGGSGNLRILKVLGDCRGNWGSQGYGGTGGLEGCWVVRRHLRALGDSRSTGQPEDSSRMAQEGEDTGDDQESLGGGGWGGMRTLELLGVYKTVRA